MRTDYNKPIQTALDLAETISRARKGQNISQSDLAGITGTSRRFIIDLEKGKATAQVGKLLLVLEALGVQLNAKF